MTAVLLGASFTNSKIMGKPMDYLTFPEYLTTEGRKEDRVLCTNKPAATLLGLGASKEPTFVPSDNVLTPKTDVITIYREVGEGTKTQKGGFLLRRTKTGRAREN